MDNKLINIIAVVSAYFIAANVNFSFATESLWDTAPHESLILSYDTPGDANTALPLGNGDIGASVWVEPNGDLVFFIGKTDAWGPHGRLMKVGKVRVRLDSPLNTEKPAFRQTLDMSTGTLLIESGREGQPTSLRLWVDAHHPVIHVETTASAPIAIRATVEPWRTGERTLNQNEIHYVDGFSRDEPRRVWPDVVVQTPPASLENHLVWYHRNETTIYPSTLRLQALESFPGQDPILYRTSGCAIGGAGLVAQTPTMLVSEQPALRHHITIHPLTLQTPTAGAWLTVLARQVEEDATRDEIETRLVAHREWWKAFWRRSWIRISGEVADDAQEIADINSGYHAHRYLVACGARGAFPVKFNGGMFNVGGYDPLSVARGLPGDCPDFRRWGTPFWFQNQRHIYWPMLQAGDYEQLLPFFRMYRNALDLAKARTKIYYGHDGAFFPETMYFWGAYFNFNYGWDRTGKPLGLADNGYIRRYWQGGLELAAMMLAWHRHTGDDETFRTLCMPVISEVITFYDQHYKRDANGKIRFYPAQVLESIWDAENPLPEIAGLKANLDNLLSLSKRFTTAGQRTQWRRMQMELPPLPITEINGTPVLDCAGKVRGERKNQENARLYAVWPYRLYGANMPDYMLAMESWNHRPVKFGHHSCWHNDIVWAAMLGLPDEARTQLANRFVLSGPYRFPAMYINGDFTPDHDNGGVCQNTLQSMLMQSDGDKLFLLPAWPRQWNVSFKLNAPGQTTIECEVREGMIVRLKVTPESRHKDVTICPPFEISK